MLFDSLAPRLPKQLFVMSALSVDVDLCGEGSTGSHADETTSPCVVVSETLGSTGLTAVPNEDAKAQALAEHRARISRAHREAAQAATNAQLQRLREAQAANMTVEEYMIASEQRVSVNLYAAPDVKRALQERLSR